MKEAYHKRDLAMAHRLVLELACSPIGPSKRIRNAVRATVFDSEELGRELVKPATAGGFGAKQVDRKKLKKITLMR